jgi:hypothetical protein
MDAMAQLSQNQSSGYKCIYNIENMIRISIHSYYRSKKGTSYFNNGTFPKYEDKWINSKEKIDIVKLIKSVISKEKKYELKKKNISEIFYLPFPILISMLENYWSSGLSDIFIDNIDNNKLVSKLKDIVELRNAIAHNRPINSKENVNLQNVYYFISESMETKYINLYQYFIKSQNSELQDTFIKYAEEIIKSCQGYTFIKANTIYKMVQILDALELNTSDQKIRENINKMYLELLYIEENMVKKYNIYARKADQDSMSDLVTNANVIKKIESFIRQI